MNGSPICPSGNSNLYNTVRILSLPLLFPQILHYCHPILLTSQATPNQAVDMPSYLIIFNKASSTDATTCFRNTLEAALKARDILEQVETIATSPHILRFTQRQPLSAQVKSAIKHSDIVDSLFIEDGSEDEPQDKQSVHTGNTSVLAHDNEAKVSFSSDNEAQVCFASDNGVRDTNSQPPLPSPASKITIPTDSKVHDGLSQSPLLTLPPEIRNEIYRYVLVTENNIRVEHDQKPPPDPALLLTCSQIRNEAIRIFYCGNRFSLSARNHDVQRLHSWYKFKIKYQPRILLTVNYTDKNWHNLVQWLELFFKREMLGLSDCYEDGTIKKRVLNTFFRLVRKMRKAGMDWERVSGMLEEVHLLLKLQYTGW